MADDPSAPVATPGRVWMSLMALPSPSGVMSILISEDFTIRIPA